jgi:hypothetical protein
LGLALAHHTGAAAVEHAEQYLKFAEATGGAEPGADVNPRSAAGETTEREYFAKGANSIYSPGADGNLDFTRNDGVASVRISRWLEPKDALRLEGLLRDFLEEIASRNVEQAMAQKAAMSAALSAGQLG